MIRDLVDICPDAEGWIGNGHEHLHDCHIIDLRIRVNTDCGHALRSTDPACTGCALRSDE